jgi:para-nitrobenzyl esterase
VAARKALNFTGVPLIKKMHIGRGRTKTKARVYRYDNRKWLAEMAGGNGWVRLQRATQRLLSSGGHAPTPLHHRKREGRMAGIPGRVLAILGMLMATPAIAGPRATTTTGIVEGAGKDGVLVFRGISYAAAPTGANRWRGPQPFPRWSGVRQATQFGHGCWQAVSPQGFGPWTHEYVVQGDISEDCLFLNVWAPARHSGKLPVLVWIHGGGFNSGSGALPIYDGQSLASQGAIVVTINYRVGVLGFLAHPELTAEAGKGASGNYGLLDTIAALKWVKDNIAAFGGDPQAVTIAGQSAGSMAVHLLVASPSAKGLFTRAIGESGLPRPLPSLANAEQQGLAFAQEKKAPDLAALRAMPVEALQASTGANAVRFVPVADGALLPDADARPVSDVPMLVGFTADEASSSRADYGSADPATLAALIGDTYGANAAGAASLYPAATDAERAEANRQVRRDRNMAGILDWYGRRGAAARAPVFAYSFDHVMPGAGSEQWGAFHSSEIPYVFQTFAAAPERRFADEDQRLSAMMSSYWLAFIRSGDPNGGGRPVWPTLVTGGPEILKIGRQVVAAPLLPPEKLTALSGARKGQ